MQTLLLKYQYPSVYSLGIKIHPLIKIKPLLFVLQILMDENIQYLTKEELAILAISGHNQNCYDFCIEKIMELRDGWNLDGLLDTNDYYTPRTIGRTKEDAIKDILDIANTCKNYLQACCLIDVEKIDGREKIYLNADMFPIIQSALELKDEFITVSNEETFQRSFGAWDCIKDTRRLVSKESHDAINARNSIIIAGYFSFAGQNFHNGLPEEFIEKMVNDYGFTRKQVAEAISPYIKESLSYFEASFIEFSKSGIAKATEFEKAVTSIFKEKFKFDARHTGQLKRPSGGVGAYADVLLENQCCAIIDAKATAGYSLPSDDFYKMKNNYMKNYTELTGKNILLDFCSYVAGGFASGFEGKIKTLTNETGVPASGITAYELLNIARIENIEERREKIIAAFKNNKIITNLDFKD